MLLWFKMIGNCSKAILVVTIVRMSTPEKCMFTNKKQYEKMVEYMTRHSDLAKGYLNVPDAKSKSSNMWEKLCSNLNALGPPERDVKGWKKVWADFKNHVKSKCRRNRSSISGTGGGPSKYCSITPLEQQTSNLLSIEEAVSGMSGTQEFGARSQLHNMPTSSQSSSVENVLNENLDSSSEAEVQVKSTPRRPIKKVLDKDALLEKQVENQMTYQESSVTALKEVNENMIGLQKYLRRSYEVQDRMYQLEKEKLQLKKQKIELEKEKFKFKKEKFAFKKMTELEKSKRKIKQLEMKKIIVDRELEKRK